MINPTLMRTYMDVPAATTVYRPSSTGSPTVTFQDAVASAAAPVQGEKFTISEEGKAALQKSQSAYEDIVNHPDPEVNVKQYAVPDWLSDYGVVIIGGTIGRPYHETIMYGNNAKFAAADDNIKAEFYSGIRQHYLTILDKNGLHTPEDRYNALIADKNRSEEIHQQFKASIATDEKLQALMQTIGISLN